MTSPAPRSSATFTFVALTLACTIGGCEIDRDGEGYFLGGPEYPAGAGLGGDASGGAALGGTATGGTGTGGSATSGGAPGGAATGGAAGGAAAQSGTATGGTAPGGTAPGGADAGGADAGGVESGGLANGGGEPGGAAVGGAETGGGEPGGAGVSGAAGGGAAGLGGGAGTPSGGAAPGGAAGAGAVAGASGFGGTTTGGVAGGAGASGVAGAAGSGAAGGAAGGVTPGGAGGEGGRGDDKNLIENSGFEEGLEGWEIYGAAPRSDVTITATPDAAHSGEQCLLVVGRDQDEQGPAYSLTGLVAEGESYRLVVWARLPDGADPDPIGRFAASVRVTCGLTSSTVRVLQDQTVRSGAWSEHTGTFSVQCAVGTPSAVVVYFHAPARVDAFYIDDVVVEPLP